MYCGVPSTAPVRVTSLSSARGRAGSSMVTGSGEWSSTSRARPKSVTITRPLRLTRTFSGLKSRCTSPAAWAATRPRPASTKARSTSSVGRGPSWIHRLRVVPSTRSIATKTPSSVAPTSWTATTLGWATRAMAWASRSSRAWRSWRAVPDGVSATTLMATLRSSSGS